MDRFIVGTGRCGSTLLSRMLAENPETLSLFEYFNGLDAARRFASEPVPGEEFAALISAEQPMLTAVLRRGYDAAEVTYPFEDESRYGRNGALPWILVSMLPRLSTEPDRLFDDVMHFAEGLSVQRMVDHHRALFDWLCARFGKAHWIERAGSSIDYLGALAAKFPDARFLHIHRDGYETALSMRGHHAYRLPIALMYRAQEGTGPPLASIDFRAEPQPDDPISRILAAPPPVDYYGRYWSDQVRHGSSALRRIEPERYREVRFEDLVTDPRETLERICDFLALDAGAGWIDAAAGLVAGVPPLRFPGLPEEEREILIEACRPGRELLAQ